MLLGWAIVLVLAIELLVGGLCLYYLAHNSDAVATPAASLRALRQTQRSTQYFSVEGISSQHEVQQTSKNNKTVSPTRNVEPSLNIKRRTAVIDAFQHSWIGYRKFAWGRDEVTPLKGGYNDAWGGFAVTMIDALDTAMMMGLHAETEEAIAWLASNLHFDKNHDVSVFEMTIRVLGGLISAHDLSGGDARLLKLARHVGDQLLPGVSPAPSAVLNIRSGRIRRGPGNIAEQGTLQLEYARLSAVAPDEHKYWTATGTFAKLLYGGGSQSDLALRPPSLNGGYDSFYEYILKLFLIGNKTDVALRQSYTNMARSVRTDLVKTCEDGSSWIGQRRHGEGGAWMEHLACFAPGMLALGVLSGASDAAAADTRAAIATAESCYSLYSSSPTGLAPDSVSFDGRPRSQRGKSHPGICSGKVHITGEKYSLRPETIESLFYLWRLTRNETYREWGWHIFQSLNAHCRTPVGYAGLLDVQRSSSREDSEPSFFMAEVLKYLFLLFSDDDVLPLDEWVLNTEAHPLRVKHRPTTRLVDDRVVVDALLDRMH